jgi:metal-responsive CopG/Arc/MetJ family transcriptional regulator
MRAVIKMEIVSISLDKKTLDELNTLQEKLDYKSRSKLILASLDSFMNEYKILDSAKGHIDSVFTLTYTHKSDLELNKLFRKYEGIIRTEIHQHHAGICLRVLILCGDAKQVKEFFSKLKIQKGVRSINVSIL